MMNGEITKAKVDWANGAHHDGLCSLAVVYKINGVSLDDAKIDAKALYDTLDTPKERDGHHKEIDEAFDKVYATNFSKKASNGKRRGAYKTGVSYKEAQKAWRALQGDVTDLKTAILASDISEVRIPTKKALKALFCNADGRVSQGNSYEDKSWMYTSDDFKDLKGTAKYTSLCTFGDAIDEEEQKEADAKGWKKTCYQRKDGNVLKVCGLLLEFDEPMTMEKVSKDAFGYLSEEEQKERRDCTLTDTCLVIERSGLKPTTVTFSGNRSYHFVFRLKTPVTPDELDAQCAKLKSIYARIGADEKTLTVSRLTRMPRGVPQIVAKDGKEQRVMYLDKDAEYELTEIVEKLGKVADEIAAADDKKITIPVFEKPSKTGGTTWVYAPASWEEFLKDIGLTVVVKKDDFSNPFLIVSREDGVYREVSPYIAADHCIRSIRRYNPTAAAWFRELRAAKLKSASLEQYAGLTRKLVTPRDGRDRVYAPFRNGLLEITPTAVTLNDSYCDYDISIESPTILREYKQCYEQSEFETFLNHACGEVENISLLQEPRWLQRKHSIMTLIGYLVSQYKEKVNWLNVLTEETMTENMGRTGKSLIMKSIKYWRKRYFKDCKNMTVQNDRFKWSGLHPDTAYIQMDDLPKGFDIQTLFSLSTDELELERKGKDFQPVAYEDVPKFVIGTNYYPKGEGDSFDGRMKIYEISNHYSAKLTPEDEFGHRLFEGWDEQEWQRFDCFVVECVQMYLTKGLLPCPCTNAEEKRLEVNMSSEVAAWIEDGVVDGSHINVWRAKKYLPKDFADWFAETYGRNVKPQAYGVKYLVAKIKEYAAVKGYGCREEQHRLNGISERCILVDNLGTMLTNAIAAQKAKDVSQDDAKTSSETELKQEGNEAMPF